MMFNVKTVVAVNEACKIRGLEPVEAQYGTILSYSLEKDNKSIYLCVCEDKYLVETMVGDICIRCVKVNSLDEAVTIIDMVTSIW